MNWFKKKKTTASEYVAAVKREAEIVRPGIDFPGISYWVDNAGCLRDSDIRGYTAKDAIKLARWILETFEEEKKDCAITLPKGLSIDLDALEKK